MRSIFYKRLFFLGIFIFTNTNSLAAKGPKNQAGSLDPQPGERLAERIVAIVNGTPVLYSHIQEKIQRGPLVSVSFFPATPQDSDYTKALQDAINFELILAKAKENMIEVSDDEVERELDRHLSSQGVDRSVLMRQLSAEGSTFEDYKESFGRYITLRRFQGRVIAPQIKITDKDIQTYYLKKTGSTSDAINLTLRQILIQIPTQASPEIAEAKKQMAQDVYKKLQGGLGFEEAVRIYSDGPDARTNGGLMEHIKLRDLSQSLREAISPLKVGEFSTPIQTSLGFHIFLLQDKDFSGGQEYAAYKGQLEMELRNLELMNQTHRWIKEERQKAKITVLADS